MDKNEWNFAGFHMQYLNCAPPHRFLSQGSSTYTPLLQELRRWSTLHRGKLAIVSPSICMQIVCVTVLHLCITFAVHICIYTCMAVPLRASDVCPVLESWCGDRTWASFGNGSLWSRIQQLARLTMLKTKASDAAMQSEQLFIRCNMLIHEQARSGTSAAIFIVKLQQQSII